MKVNKQPIIKVADFTSIKVGTVFQVGGIDSATFVKVPVIESNTQRFNAICIDTMTYSWISDTYKVYIVSAMLVLRGNYGKN